jgi:hypothetical protein
MNKLFLIAFALLCTCVACKQDADKKGANGTTKAEETLNMLAGHWVAIDFCARANSYGSVLQAMNETHLPYAYAFTFNPAYKDSVECFNGFEQYKLPYIINADTIQILGARGEKKPVFLVITNQDKEREITMFDPAPSGTQIDRFIKSKAGATDGYMAFVTALNHNLFSGAFTLLAKGGESNIQFTPGGFIQKFKDFDRYEVCTAGDCFAAGPEVDVITFKNSRKENSEKMFSFKYNTKHDTLTIYNLVEQNPDEKGTAVVGKPAYKFLRKFAE